MNAVASLCDIRKRWLRRRRHTGEGSLAPVAERRPGAALSLDDRAGEQAKMDWGHFATGMDGVFMALHSRCAGRGCGMSSSTQRQSETLLHCNGACVRVFGGVTQTCGPTT